MTTDRSQDSRGTTTERPCKILFLKFAQKQPSGNLLLFVLWNFIMCVITVQPTNNIKCIRSAVSRGGKKKFFFPKRERVKRGVQLSTSRTDLLKASAKRGRAYCNSIASRQVDGMDALQIRTKATNGANPKNSRWIIVVRSCCSALTSMVLGLEGCLVWCTYRSNKNSAQKSCQS